MAKYLLLACLAAVASARPDYSCIGVGSYADPTDTTCQNYYVCSVLSDGTYVATSVGCSSTKKFDPSLAACTDSYICDVNSTTSTSTSSVATVDFRCTKSGRFENPNDLSCTTYYLCSKYYGTYIKTLYKCPVSSYFDPDLGRCTTQHVCPTATTTTTTTKTTTTTSSVFDFVCTSRGRYADFKDDTCKWYYLCNQLRNGTLLRTPYSCPSGSVFDQSIYKCTTLQDCVTIRNSGFSVTPQFDS